MNRFPLFLAAFTLACSSSTPSTSSRHPAQDASTDTGGSSVGLDAGGSSAGQGGTPDAGHEAAVHDAARETGDAGTTSTGGTGGAAGSGDAPAEAGVDSGGTTDAGGSDAATTCGGGLTLCSGTCVDLQTSNIDCGWCGHACKPGFQCRAVNGGPPQCWCMTDAACSCTDPASCKVVTAPLPRAACIGGVCTCDTASGYSCAGFGAACYYATGYHCE